MNKKYSDQSPSESMKHGRTRKAPWNKVTDLQRNEILEHIKRFPTVRSHYCRKKSKKFYFEKGLDATKMWKAYKEEKEKKGEDGVKYETYRKELRTFNVGFFKPKKDQCTKCISFENSAKTPEQSKKHDLHLMNAELARKEKDADKARAKSDPTFGAYIVDLEQVSPCPKGNSGAFFYKTKISCYNFTIYDLETGEGYLYRWDQTRSLRGADEMASARLHFYTSVIPKTITEVVEYEDSCGGQNRNSTAAAAALHLTQDSKCPIEHFTQKFMESGHSESEVDSIHSTLEAVSKDAEIYHPSEWFTLSRNAKNEAKVPFHVFALGTDQCPIYNVHAYEKEKIKNKNKNLDTTGKVKSVSWMKTHIIEYGKNENPAVIGMRELYCDEHKEEIDTSTTAKRAIRSKVKNPTLKIKVDDSTPNIPIKKKTVDGLLELVKDNQIPHLYHAFYRGLASTDDVNSTDESSDDEEDVDDA